jgi:hypothetical protein
MQNLDVTKLRQEIEQKLLVIDRKLCQKTAVMHIPEWAKSKLIGQREAYKKVLELIDNGI